MLICYHLFHQIELIESIQQKEISAACNLLKKNIIELSNIFLLMASNYSMQLILKAAGFFITKTENI